MGNNGWMMQQESEFTQVTYSISKEDYRRFNLRIYRRFFWGIPVGVVALVAFVVALAGSYLLTSRGPSVWTFPLLAGALVVYLLLSRYKAA